MKLDEAVDIAPFADIPAAEILGQVEQLMIAQKEKRRGKPPHFNIITRTLPMNSQNQTHDLLPQPKFQMLDHVQYDSRTGVIVGLYYISDLTAIVDDFTPGWHYCIDFVHGKSLFEALKASRSSRPLEAPLELFATEGSISLAKEACHRSLAPTDSPKPCHTKH